PQMAVGHRHVRGDLLPRRTYFCSLVPGRRPQGAARGPGCSLRIFACIGDEDPQRTNSGCENQKEFASILTTMSTYVALLRGINLGSHNKVAMPALRAAVEGLGFQDVATYIQSGNVVLTTTDSATKVETAIAKVFADEFGIDVAVVVRSAQQLEKIVDNSPFAKKAEDPGHLHVVFLAAKPKA